LAATNSVIFNDTASITSYPSSTSSISTLTVTSLGTASFQSGTSINMDGKGYVGGNTFLGVNAAWVGVAVLGIGVVLMAFLGGFRGANAGQRAN
jgi:hypothetical protein